MDALEFLKDCTVSDPVDSDEDFKRVIAAVEQWLKKHPLKTRQSVFLEQYPDAVISNDGLPEVAPCQLCAGLIHGDSVDDCENRGLCTECRREFWNGRVDNGKPKEKL